MKKILVVVDYQNDFVSGSLGFKKAVGLEHAIINKIEQYKTNGHEVVFTFDTHYDNYLQTQEGKNLPLPHCIKDTEGWKLYGAIKQFFDDSTKAFEKSTFGSIELATYIAEGKYAQVELIGVVSNICVLSNAILAKAALPEAEIIVDADCIASNDDGMNTKTLDIMEGMQIKVIHR